MEQDYSQISYKICEIKHKYGDHAHILANPYCQTILAQLGRPDVFQPRLNDLVEILYQHLLLEAVNHCFPRELVKWDTRMKEFSSKGVFTGEVIKREIPVICVDLQRAGIWPSHLCFHRLHYLLNAGRIRQDHFHIARKTNDKEEVIGVDVAGAKIGGGQEDAIVFIPDPMGATGRSLSHVVSHYKTQVEGKALCYVALHLIVTPEYIARMKKDHPDLQIFSLRLDRGTSSPDIFKTIPGTHPDRETGLNERHYIVPGAGGVGEILNNSFV